MVMLCGQLEIVTKVVNIVGKGVNCSPVKRLNAGKFR